MEGQVPPSSPQSHSSATPAPPAAPPPPPPPASDSPPNHTTTPTPTPAPAPTPTTTAAAASIAQTGASPAPPPLASIIKTESGVVPPVVLSDHHQQQQQAPMMMLIHNNSSSSNAATPIISGASPVAMNSNNSLLGVAGAGPLKRKRGRPRKYVEGHHHHHHLHNQPVLIVGSSPSTPTPVMSGLSAISGLPTTPSASHSGMALALAPLAASSPHAHLPFAAAAAAAGILSASPSAGGGGGGAAQSPGGEKKRGRPPGSGKKQQLAALGAWLAGSAGQGFTPHVITVGAGEDVATKIISFSQIGPRATCVLSANGAISNVTLRQPSTSGGTVTYEGRFEILSLSGSFLLTENGNTRSRTGGLSVSLAGPDGRVIGGSVAGLLIAATPVQVVVGSFISETRKPVPVQVRPNSGSSNEMLGAAGAVTSPMSISRPVGSSPLNDNSINTNNANTNSSSQVTWSGNQQEDHQQQQQQQLQNQNQSQNQNAGHGTDINILPTA